jgi:catechol 2,3-dioxygenase-like lactoylglutathione lyase family enzyme
VVEDVAAGAQPEGDSMTTMLKNSPFYAGFAANDLDRTKAFYAETLGVRVIDVGPGLAALTATNGYTVLVYEKDDHEPAAHTVLNFPVDDLEATVDALRAAGVARAIFGVPSEPRDAVLPRLDTLAKLIG